MPMQAINPFTAMNRTGLTLLVRTGGILLALTYPNTALPAIFACPSGDSVVYQDRPCPIAQKRMDVSQKARSFPLSIHESWFDLPEQAEERAFCDRRACECGDLVKKHQGSLAQAVADSMYLDGSWHRYESSFSAWLQAPPSSAQSYYSRKQMLEATCNVMMSQVILRTYANDVVAALKKRVREAEELGFDIDEPCLQEIPGACAYLESVNLFNRLMTDATALRRDREGTIIPSLSQLPATEL